MYDDETPSDEPPLSSGTANSMTPTLVPQLPTATTESSSETTSPISINETTADQHHQDPSSTETPQMLFTTAIPTPPPLIERNSTPPEPTDKVRTNFTRSHHHQERSVTPTAQDQTRGLPDREATLVPAKAVTVVAAVTIGAIFSPTAAARAPSLAAVRRLDRCTTDADNEIDEEPDVFEHPLLLFSIGTEGPAARFAGAVVGSTLLVLIAVLPIVISVIRWRSTGEEKERAALPLNGSATAVSTPIVFLSFPARLIPTANGPAKNLDREWPSAIELSRTFRAWDHGAASAT